MREKMLQGMYEIYVNETMGEKTDKEFNAVTEYIAQITGSEEAREETANLMVVFMCSVFMDSANMLLDFISGREGGAV